MTDFNLEQFKAGRLARHPRKDCYLRYVGVLKSAGGNWIICAETYSGHAFETSIGLFSLGELASECKIKLEKKKLYIGITKTISNDSSGFMCTDAMLSEEAVIAERDRILKITPYSKERNAFTHITIVEVEIEV